MKKKMSGFARWFLCFTLVSSLMIFPGGVSFAGTNNAASDDEVAEKLQEPAEPKNDTDADDAVDKTNQTAAKPALEQATASAPAQTVQEVDSTAPAEDDKKSAPSATPPSDNSKVEEKSESIKEVELTYSEDKTLAQLGIANAAKVVSVSVVAVSRRNHEPITSDANLLKKRLVDIDKSLNIKDTVGDFIDISGNAGNFKIRAAQATEALLPEDMLITISCEYADNDVKQYDVFVSKARVQLSAPGNGGIPYGVNIQDFLDEQENINEFVGVYSRDGKLLEISADELLASNDLANVISYDSSKFSSYPSIGEDLQLIWGTNDRLDNPSVELLPVSGAFACYVASHIQTDDVVFGAGNAVVSVDPGGTYWTNTEQVVLSDAKTAGQALIFSTGIDAHGEAIGVLDSDALTMPYTQVDGLFVKDTATGYVSIIGSINYDGDLPRANSLKISKPAYEIEGYNWYFTGNDNINPPELRFAVADGSGAGVKSYQLRYEDKVLVSGDKLAADTKDIAVPLSNIDAEYDMSSLELVLTDWANNVVSIKLSDITKAYTTLFVVTTAGIDSSTVRSDSGAVVSDGSTVHGSATVTLTMDKAIYTYLSLTQKNGDIATLTEDRIYQGQETSSIRTDISARDFASVDGTSFAYTVEVTGYENALTQIGLNIDINDPLLNIHDFSSSFTINKQPADIYITDGNGGLSGTYSHPVSASVYVKQTNFDTNSALLLSDKQDDQSIVGPSSFSGWEEVQGAVDTYTGVVTFSENAVYDLNISVADTAGTRSELYPLDTFEVADEPLSVKVDFIDQIGGKEHAVSSTDSSNMKQGFVRVTFLNANATSVLPEVVINNLNSELPGATFGAPIDNETHTECTITSSLLYADNNYVMDIAALDGIPEPEQYTFIIDNMPPQNVTFAFADDSDPVSSTPNNGKIYGHERELTITVQDSSFVQPQPAPELFVTDSLYYSEGLEKLEINSISGWEPNEDENGDVISYSCIVRFEDDGIFDLLFIVKDRAGNIHNSGLGTDLSKFTIDTDYPVVQLDILDPASDSVTNYRYFNQVPKLSAVVSDLTTKAPPADIKVCKLDDDGNVEEEFVIATPPENWRDEEVPSSEPTGTTKKSIIAELDAVITEDGVYQIKATSYDLAGNGIEVSDPKHFVIDTNEPEIELRFSEDNSPLPNGYFPGPVTATITVTDKYFTSDATLKNPLPKYVTNGKLPVAEFFGWVQDKENPEKYTAEVIFSEDGIYSLAAQITDLAGNPNTSGNLDFKIDSTPPELIIQFSDTGNEQAATRYYNTNRTAKILVYDEIGFVEGSRLDFSDRSSAEGSPLPDVNQTWARETIDEKEYRTTFATFSQEGTYDFTVTVNDEAGRSSNPPVEIGIFTIDKTEPTLFVEFDNNEASSVNYYNAPRTATIHVMDENFAEGVANVSALATDDTGAAAPAPAQSGWAVGESESERVSSVYFNGEYHYTLNVSARDAAGNGAEPFEEPEFIIDMTMPEIIVEGLQNTGAYAGDLYPRVTFRDAHFDDFDARVSFQKATGESAYVFDDTSVYNTTEKTVDFGNVEAIPENDNIYVMRATITDKAGNGSEEVSVFSINRFGSTYIIGADTQAFLGQYINLPKDVTIIEINPSGLVAAETRLRLSKDVDWTKNLAAGSDYVVGHGSTQDLWNMYTYTIPAGVFVEDGHYNVVARSIDRAQNLSENIMENKTVNRDASVDVNFTLDTTAPSARFVNASADQQYTASNYDVQMRVEDNLAWDHAVLYVNGKLANRFEAEGDELGSSLEYTLEKSDEMYNLRLEVYDKAGNSAVEESTNISVIEVPLAHIAEDPVSYNLAIALSILGFAVLSAFVIFLIVRKRKKDKEQVTFESPKL